MFVHIFCATGPTGDISSRGDQRIAAYRSSLAITGRSCSAAECPGC